MKPLNKTQTNLSTKWKSLFSMLLIAAMLFSLTGITQKKATAASYTVIKISSDKESVKKTVSGTTITIKRNSDGASYTISTEKKSTKKTITKKGDSFCVSDGKSYILSGSKKRQIHALPDKHFIRQEE